MNSINPLIISIAKSPHSDNLIIGSKAKNLIKAKKYGINVPDGIILSVEFMEVFQDFLTQIPPNSSTTFNRPGLILKILGSHKIATLRNELLPALELIDFQFKRKFAVRSAATIEDGQFKSYAGQFDTFLNVSETDLMESIAKCYLSWWNERALVYNNPGNNNVKPEISILIQEYIDADFSGVLFTCNPITHYKQIVIEGIEGIGEQLVSGKKEPSFVWQIDEFESKKPKISLIKNRNNAQINQSLILTLIENAKALEKIFSENLDIEWAIKDNKLFILQIRPITGIKNAINDLDLAKGKYCRTIIEDLWSDKMTNITSSIIFGELSDIYSFKKIFTKLGLKALAENKAVEVYNGYGYLSSDLVAKMLEILPASLRFTELSNSFHPSDKSSVLKIKTNKRKIIKTIARSVLLLNEQAAFPFLTRRVLFNHQKTITRQLHYYQLYSDENLMFYRKELERLIGLLGSLQEKNQWGYGYASLFAWLTRHYAINYLKFDEGWLLEKLRIIPDNVSIRIQSRLIEIAKLCDDHVRQEVIEKFDNKKAWQILQKDFSDHPFCVELNKFIKEYGVRSSNRDFIHSRWYESPQILLTHISSMFSTNNSEKNNKHDYSIRKSFTQLINMPVLGFLLNNTKKFIALREDLRFTLDICFYKIRQLLIAISQNKVFVKHDLFANWIFFLELNELRELLEHPHNIQDLIPKLQLRKDTYFKEISTPPSCYLKTHNGDIIPHLIEYSQTSKSIETYKGIAASAGIVEGRVRIIIDETDFNKLTDGDILVAFNTDPGWTPLFLKAKAVLVEIGGILNHCSIVAREYGIPAIVGLNGITKLLHNDQWIRVNGAEGIVEVLKQ